MTALRVLTYNVHSCVGTDGRYDVDRVARACRAADIVCLQEVEANAAPRRVRRWSATHADDQPALIARACNLPYHHFFASVNGGLVDARPEVLAHDAHAAYGNAILSRWPILRTKILRFGTATRRHMHMDRDEQPRAALAALVDTRPPLWIVTTHLSHKWWSAEHAHQLGRLHMWTRRLRGHLLVTGDLNAPAWWARRDDWRDLGAGPTFPSQWPCLRIDHIFARGIFVHDHTHVHSSDASDHAAVVASVHIEQRQ